MLVKYNKRILYTQRNLLQYYSFLRNTAVLKMDSVYSAAVLLLLIFELFLFSCMFGHNISLLDNFSSQSKDRCFRVLTLGLAFFLV